MKFAKGIGLGLGFGIASLVIMLILVSAILLSSDVTLERINFWGNAVLFASAIVAGAISSMITKKSGWLVGLVSGGLLWGVVALISWLSSDETFVVSLLPIILAIGAGLTGGMLASLIVRRQ